MKEGGEEMEIWSDRWLEHQARKLGLKICYVKIGGAGEGAMMKDEKTAENLERRGKRNYEQNLEIISGRGEKDAGEDRQKHFGEGKRDENPQTAITIQIDNKGEIRK